MFVITDCNIFVCPTRNPGDVECPCRFWFLRTPYPLDKRLTPVATHPSQCSLAPEQVPHNKSLLTYQREHLGHSFVGGNIFCCRKTMNSTAGPSQNTSLLEWEMPKVVVFCGHNLCDKLTARARMLQHKGETSSLG